MSTIQDKKYGVRVMAAFALELGRIHSKDYTDATNLRPKYITRPELIRIGIENGNNALVAYVNAHPKSREPWMTDEMLAPNPIDRKYYTRLGVRLSVPGKATQPSAVGGTSRNPVGPRLPDGTPQYKMDIFFDALDEIVADCDAADFAKESLRTEIV